METQLALFDLLTPEQEENKQLKINMYNDSAEKRYNQLQQIEKLLVEAGFIKYVHYTANYRLSNTTTNINVGTYKSQKYIDIVVKCVEGNLSLLRKYLNLEGDKIVNTNASLSIDNGKLQCYILNNNFRYVKPSTLFEKLKSHNLSVEEDLQNKLRKNDVLKYTIEKYSNLYPEANITSAKEVKRFRNDSVTYDIVTITFKSGSYVKFNVGREKDTERVYSKFDALADKLSLIETLDMFNNQKALD
jgi:hypothetical protein